MLNNYIEPKEEVWRGYYTIEDCKACAIRKALDIDSSVYNASKPSEEKQEYYSKPSSYTDSYTDSSSNDSGIHIQGNF